MGRTITNPAGLLLKVSTETTNAGRRPACSCPLVGSKSTIHTSPRAGFVVLIPPPHRPPTWHPTLPALPVLPATPWDCSAGRQNQHSTLRGNICAGIPRWLSPARLAV